MNGKEKDYSGKNGKYKCPSCDFRSDKERLITEHNENIHLKVKVCQYKTYFYEAIHKNT